MVDFCIDDHCIDGTEGNSIHASSIEAGKAAKRALIGTRRAKCLNDIDVMRFMAGDRPEVPMAFDADAITSASSCPLQGLTEWPP